MTTYTKESLDFDLRSIFNLEATWQEFETYARGQIPTLRSYSECYDFVHKWRINSLGGLYIETYRHALNIATSSIDCKNIANQCYQIADQANKKAENFPQITECQPSRNRQTEFLTDEQFEYNLSQIKTYYDYRNLIYSNMHKGRIRYQKMVDYGMKLIEATSSIEECMSFIGINRDTRLFEAKALEKAKELALQSNKSSEWLQIYDLYSENASTPSIYADNHWHEQSIIKQDLLGEAKNCAKNFSDYYGLVTRTNAGNTPKWDTPNSINLIQNESEEACFNLAENFSDYFLYWAWNAFHYTEKGVIIAKKMVEAAKTPEDKMRIYLVETRRREKAQDCFTD